MIVIFDTETTGKNPRTARLVQLAGLLISGPDDPVATFNEIVTPETFEIPEEASAIHGITTEHAWNVGRPLDEVLEEFTTFLEPAKRAVGHNLAYDNTVLMCEHHRIARDPSHLLGLAPFCTMIALTDRMKLAHKQPWRAQSGGFKWPTLAEAHKFCGLGEHTDAHNALGDVNATRRIYLHGVAQQWWR